MKFDIRITFDGLYLLAVQDDPKLVHALLINFGEDVPYDADNRHVMPASSAGGNGHGNGGGHGNGHAAHAGGPGAHAAGEAANGGNGNGGAQPMAADHPKHYAMLYFDAAHLAVSPEEREQMTGHPFGVSLKDRVVRLQRPNDNTPPSVELDPKIIGIDKVSDAKDIDPAVLGLRPSRIIAGRVTLASGAPKPVPKKNTEDFDVVPAGKTDPTETVTIATRVEWEIKDVEGVNLNTFPLVLRNIDTDEVVATHVLRPVTILERDENKKIVEKNVIRLHVYCAGSRDLPGGAVIHPLERGAPMPHFSGFFQLFPNVKAPTLRIHEIQRTGSTEQCTGMRVAVRTNA